jgi:hypothetical protein
LVPSKTNEIAAASTPNNYHAGLTQPIGGPDAPPVADGGKQLFVNRHP